MILLGDMRGFIPSTKKSYFSLPDLCSLHLRHSTAPVMCAHKGRLMTCVFVYIFQAAANDFSVWLLSRGQQPLRQSCMEKNLKPCLTRICQCLRMSECERIDLSLLAAQLISRRRLIKSLAINVKRPFSRALHSAEGAYMERQPRVKSKFQKALDRINGAFLFSNALATLSKTCQMACLLCFV